MTGREEQQLLQGGPRDCRQPMGISVPCHICEGRGMRPVVSLLPAQGLGLGAATSIET